MIEARLPRTIALCATLLLAMCLYQTCHGQATDATQLEIPLVEQEPFDLILLDEINGNIEIKIKPLKQPLPDPLPAQGFLVFEAPDLSDDRLQVPFTNIVRFQSFNDLLRSEANEFIRNEEYGRAFRNLIYIYDHGGKSDPSITGTIQNLLFRDAAKNYLSGNFELALTMFQDIYDRDPNFQAPGISKRPIDLILDCLDKNIAAKFSAEQFAQVRAAIDDLELRYGPEAEPLVEKWRAKTREESDRLLADSRQLLASGDGKLAHLTARRANTILPGRPEILELFQEIVDRFPIVFVGVGQGEVDADPLSLDNWGSRRVGSLTKRVVVEFSGPGDDGGKYEFLNGSLEQIDDNGFVYRFTIDPDVSGFAIPPTNAYELSRRMLARGSIYSDEYNVPFARIVDTIEIENEFSVVVHLKRAYIRPEALFQFPYGTSMRSAVANGPYRMTEKNEQVMVFEKNPAYPELEHAQHPQIIEWKFPSASAAVDSLIAGEIDVVDRILPSDLDRLEQNAAIEVGSYIVPTVHMLVPNARNEFMSDRTFRNGLKHGIDRELILRETICGGRDINGCEIISGPFPIGTEENDQVSYAYNLSVKPQPFNDRLGMVLARVIYETQINLLVKQGVKDPQIEFPTIVLAHAADEVPELACTNIQQMWAAMGMKVVLRKLKDGVVIPPDDDWDFLYYQISMREPLIDAEHLFGRNGIVEEISAPAKQNLDQLGYADSWQRAARVLRGLHRQVVNDVTIIPLWQIKEHYAFRENLTGILRYPVNLYDNVADWQITSTREEK